MAGLKTPPKKKKAEGKPGAVLAIFLVIFILGTIGAGVWGYYGYDGQDKLRGEAKTALAKEKVAKAKLDYQTFLARELRFAAGHAPFDPEELKQYSDDVKEFWKAGEGKFKDDIKDDKNYEAYKKTYEEMRKDLGFDDDGKKYVSTYKEKLAKAAKDVSDARGLVNKAMADKAAADERFNAYQAQREKKYNEQKDEFKKENDNVLTKAKERTEEMKNIIKRNDQLDGQIRDATAKLLEAEEKFKRDLKKRDDEIAVLRREKSSDTEPEATKVGQGIQHALILDISKGYSLWDNPVGRVTRVDLENRHVYISVGSAQGIQPELTFNVFGATTKNRAEGTLKGSIEVVRVLDTNNSIARITSLYDSAGQEIVLSDAARGRALREADNAFKENDLLFNMFWGSRIAILGNVSLTGQYSDSPAEQLRNIDTLSRFLNRQGIQVDAFLDPTDGQLKGAITNRTRYLIGAEEFIRGKMRAPGAAVPPKEPEKQADGEEKKDEKKDEEMKKDEQPAGQRAALFHAAAAKMRADAIDKGLFLISFDNFLSVIGYRQARSANANEATGYRPSVITGEFGLRTQPTVNGNGNGKKEKAPEPKGEEKMEKDKMP